MTGLELSFRNSIVKSTEKGSSNTLYMDIYKKEQSITSTKRNCQSSYNILFICCK